MPEQEPGDDARLAEQHDHGKVSTKGGETTGSVDTTLNRPPTNLPHADIDLHIGEQQADEGGQDAHQKAHLQGIGDGGGKARHGEDAPERIQTQRAVSHKTIHQQDGQRIEDKQSQKCDEHDDGSDHDGVCHQFFPIQRRTLGSCHRTLLSHPKDGRCSG